MARTRTSSTEQRRVRADLDDRVAGDGTLDDDNLLVIARHRSDEVVERRDGGGRAANAASRAAVQLL